MATARSGHATYHLDANLVAQSQAGNYSTIQIHLYAIADSGWSGFASGIGWSASGNSGTFSFNGGGDIEIAVYNINVGHDSNGYYSGTATAHVNDTGTETLGGPVDLAQAISVPRIPKVPSAPGISIASVVARTVSITVTAPADNGGSSITKYTVQYSADGGSTWAGAQYGGSTVYTNLPPGTYKFRAFATNAIGNGAIAMTGSTTLRSGGKVRQGGAWRTGLGKVRAGGSMHDPIVKVRAAGAWKDAL